MALLVALALAGSGATATESAQDAAATGSVVADHVAIHVADLDASVAFYNAAFGIREIATAVPGTRWMSLGPGVELHLLGGRTTPVATPRQVHFALRTTNLAGIIDYLRSRRMHFEDFAGNAGAINRRRSDGVRQVFIRDPDGYWIEVNGTLPPGFPEPTQ